MLTINDTFKTKKEAQAAIRNYASSLNFSFETFDSTPKHYTIYCKGKRDFNCDAHITASLRKKDDVFVIKKIKTSHKCPPEIHDKAHMSSIEYINSEIENILGGKKERVGEMVSILARRQIKLGYFTVWKSMRMQNYQMEEQENEFNIPIDTIPMEIVFSDALMELKDEFLSLNTHSYAFCTNNTLFLSFPSILAQCRRIVEIKFFERKNEGRDVGEVIFGVVYDPLDTPLIYSILVAERYMEGQTMGTLADSLDTFLAQHPKDTVFIAEYNKAVIEALERQKSTYFIKVRNICKQAYETRKDRAMVERVWRMCNSSTEQAYLENKVEEISVDVPVNRYIKCFSGCYLYNIQNFSEVDVDWVYPSVFAMPFFDCVNSIIKLISDNLKSRRSRLQHFNTPKSMFGDNIAYKIDKNVAMASGCSVKENVVNVDGADFIVDLKECTCSCGKYQEYLVPCLHACSVILARNEDPFRYVSVLYSKDTLAKVLIDIVPVINEPVKCPSDRSLLRRGPGRPKKRASRKKDEPVQ